MVAFTPPLEPLLLEPTASRRLWGGKRLAPMFGIDLGDDPTPIGEIWTAYAGNRIAGGAHDGLRLERLIASQGEALIGSEALRRHGRRMPLLAKFIDAAAPLSIQVHPDDSYAARFESESGHLGKSEAWYVLIADAGAEIVWGWRHDVEAAEVAAAVVDETMEHLLNRVPVAPGDVIYNPPGLVHAIGSGILLFEIQQDSDLTYRLYDYGRRDAEGELRALHLDKALQVADLTGGSPRPHHPELVSSGWTTLIESEFFVLERLGLSGRSQQASLPHSLTLITSYGGPVGFVWAGGVLTIPAGSSLVVPALLGSYALEGEATVFRSSLPQGAAR